MKRVILNYLVISTISVSAAFMSCNKEKVQLLESISHSDGRFEKYEYDNESRITKTLYYNKEGGLIYSQTLTYRGDDFIKVMLSSDVDSDFVATIEYSKSGNIITITTKNNGSDNVETTTVALDNDGFPTKYELNSDEASSVGVFETHGGNLTKHSYKVIRGDVTLEGSSDFKYDNKKSPFYYCKTPKWWWILADKCISTQNNVIEMSNTRGEKVEYKYEFDNAGYPTKCTAKSSESEYVSKYKYK